MAVIGGRGVAPSGGGLRHHGAGSRRGRGKGGGGLDGCWL